MAAVWRSWQWWRASRARLLVSTLVITAALLWGSYGESYPSAPRDRIVNGHPVPQAPPAAFVLVALACLVLVGRRRWPLATLAASTAAVIGYTALGYVNGAVLVAPAIALYQVGLTRSVRRALVAAVLTMVALMAATAAANPFATPGGGFSQIAQNPGGFDLIPFLVAAGCLGGIAVANRRAYAASVQRRMEADARRHVDEERLRIARELHDVVAHTMATINVQAGVAAHLLGERPDDPVRETLVTIRNASKQGLAELRSILGVLRGSDEAEATQPTPGLEQLPGLLEGARAAGVTITVTISGTTRPLPAAVSLAAYRIVQESLTNAIRHAPGSSAAVTLDYQPAGLALCIRNSSAARVREAAEGSGHGLVGMAERAASIGGRLESGPEAGGGWCTRAWLPSPAGSGANAAPGAAADSGGDATTGARAGSYGGGSPDGGSDAPTVRETSTP